MTSTKWDKVKAGAVGTLRGYVCVIFCVISAVVAVPDQLGKLTLAKNTLCIRVYLHRRRDLTHAAARTDVEISSPTKAPRSVISADVWAVPEKLQP